jgi:hypothetical protein
MRFVMHTVGLAVGVSLIVSLQTSGVVALGSDDPPASGTRLIPAPPLRTVPADLRELVPAFRREQRADDQLPGDPLAALEAQGDRQPGENPLLARRLDARDAHDVYVWPMVEGVCYASPGPGGCVPTTQLREQGVAVATSFTSRSPTVRVFGLAADGVEEVVFGVSDGSEQTVGIRDGAFYLELEADPTEMRWARPNGEAMMQRGLVVRPSR